MGNLLYKQSGPRCTLYAGVNQLELMYGVQATHEEIEAFFKKYDPNFGKPREGLRMYEVLNGWKETPIAGYKVKSYRRLYLTTKWGKISGTKISVIAAIQNPNKAVTVGIRMHGKYIKLDDHYRLIKTEGDLNFHAMCPVMKEGNRFAIVKRRGVPCIKLENSWGDDWGDGGFCYLPIRDFDHHIAGAYEFTLTK